MNKMALSLTLLIIFSLVPLTATSAPPEIGAAARIESSELGPGWHYGFFNQLRVHPPCYLVMFFEKRNSSGDPLTIRATIPIDKVTRLQISSEPGSSMGEWDGSKPVIAPERLWQEVQLEPLLPERGRCNYDFSNK